MKKITILLLFLFVISGSFAQKNKKEVIYLKNGSIIKGERVRVDDDKVVIRTNRNTWVFNDSEIDTVTSKFIPGTLEYDNKSYFVKTTFGVLAGSSNNTKSTPFSFDASFNYSFFPQLYAGLGLGVDLLEESYMPAFLNLEYHFRESRFTPFLGLQAGYLIPLDGDIHTYGNYYYYPLSSSYYPYSQQALSSKGGMMFNPSFGFLSQINENLGLVFSFGYRFQQVTFKGDDHYQLEREYNRLSIRLGIIFN